MKKIILTKDFFSGGRAIIILGIQVSLGLTSDSYESALAQLYAVSFECLCLKLEFVNRIKHPLAFYSLNAQILRHL